MVPLKVEKWGCAKKGDKSRAHDHEMGHEETYRTKKGNTHALDVGAKVSTFVGLAVLALSLKALKPSTLSKNRLPPR